MYFCQNRIPISLLPLLICCYNALSVVLQNNTCHYWLFCRKRPIKPYRTVAGVDKYDFLMYSSIRFEESTAGKRRLTNQKIPIILFNRTLKRTRPFEQCPTVPGGNLVSFLLELWSAVSTIRPPVGGPGVGLAMQLGISTAGAPLPLIAKLAACQTQFKKGGL